MEERLTKKRDIKILGFTNDYTLCKRCEEGEIIDKLGQLEDIEEDCNIDIIKSVELCKKVNAKKKVYVKKNWGINVLNCVYIDEIEFLDDLDVEIFNHRLYSSSRGIYICLDINEYGITWALDREELK